MPFDEFAIDQLAGDLRPGDHRGPQVATGFHRNTPINQEGGIDVEQFRVESIIDRVNTTGSVFLGLTIGCCQCHDHKYDPICQREYYRLFAFFNNVDEPELEIATPADAGPTARPVRDQIDEFLDAVATRDPRPGRVRAHWERTLTLAVHAGPGR